MTHVAALYSNFREINITKFVISFAVIAIHVLGDLWLDTALILLSWIGLLRCIIVDSHIDWNKVNQAILNNRDFSLVFIGNTLQGNNYQV